MDVLSKIKPGRKEEAFVRKEARKFISRINKKLKNAKAVIGGSFEKNTWLSGKYDIDIFVKFNYKKYREKDISKELEHALKYFKKTKIHGSRDYFQIKHGKLNLEIVPVLDVKNYRQALNVTDVSPLHSKFVKQNSNKKIQDEIRITKQFLKANNIYGAESYIRGLSGYLVELLLIYYKSFNSLIKNAAKWPDSLVIDIKKHYKNKEDATRNINWAKRGPLIMIDPVQKNRNVAAALSKEKYENLKQIAKDYLENPNDGFFFEKKFDLNALKGYIVLRIMPKPGKRDIVGAKLLKLFEYIKNKTKEEGFELTDHGWHFNKISYFWFKTEKEEIDLVRKHYGPFVDDFKNLKNFKKKWKGYKVYKEKNKTYILVERKFPRIRYFLKNLIKEKDIKENVKKIEIFRWKYL
ncbi:MAG: CCA tRNA nucleotidyltransferase [Nanoarchaeota archaeon]